MTISIGAATPPLGKIADVRIATPADKRTDDACAAQDSATETLSQGIARHRSDIDRLLDQPGPLDRFSPVDARRLVVSMMVRGAGILHIDIVANRM